MLSFGCWTLNIWSFLFSWISLAISGSWLFDILIFMTVATAVSIACHISKSKQTLLGLSGLYLPQGPIRMASVFYLNMENLVTGKTLCCNCQICVCTCCSIPMIHYFGSATLGQGSIELEWAHLNHCYLLACEVTFLTQEHIVKWKGCNLTLYVFRYDQTLFEDENKNRMIGTKELFEWVLKQPCFEVFFYATLTCPFDLLI